jgi:hypothetical protein
LLCRKVQNLRFLTDKGDMGNEWRL